MKSIYSSNSINFTIPTKLVSKKTKKKPILLSKIKPILLKIEGCSYTRIYKKLTKYYVINKNTYLNKIYT